MTHVSTKKGSKMAIKAKNKKMLAPKQTKKTPLVSKKGAQGGKTNKKKAVEKAAKVKEESEETSKSLDEFLETWSDEEEMEEEDLQEESDDENIDDDEASAKRYLSSLQSKDPEFYKFLKEENDEEILNFESDESDNEEEQENDDELCHKPDSKDLEVASDESDFEMEDEDDSGTKKKAPKKYTIEMLDVWSEELTSKEVSLEVINSLAGAFKDALKTIDEGVMMESALFNAIIRTCVTYFEPGLVKYLKRTKNFKESPKWNKVNKTLKSYSTDLVKLLGAVSDSAVIAVLLKHVHSMIPFYPLLPKSCKLLTKELIRIWSSSDEETLRILAFMCILRLVQRSMKTDEGEHFFESVLKSMYMSYVKNCKFVSPSTRPGIAFMRRSLSELMNLNQEVSYQHAFVYIRQLAIHLRNALTLQKKDIFKSVYNWQFVHSLHLWATLFGTAVRTNPKSVLESLIHPLIQVITGSIGLIYTSKYYPLRFHLCKILINLSNETGKFIPLLSYYTDILSNYNFNKKAKKHSMKPLDFSCILRLSKPQLMENGFKDATIDQVYAGMIELFSNYSHRICYPELATPAINTLKNFLKNTKAINYSKKMKQLLDKIIENSKWLERRRKSVTFGIGSPEEVNAWEIKSKVDGPPLLKFYTSWKKIKHQETLKAAVKSIETKEDAQDYIPRIVPRKKDKVVEDDFKGDILAGEDDDVDDVERFELKEDLKRKREESDDDSDESESEEDEEPPKKKQSNGHMMSNGITNGEDTSEDEGDEIKDLNLEDLDSDGAEDDEFEDEEDLDEEEDDEEEDSD